MPMRFVPKRSSQHRIACIALYRTLYRQAQKVALPTGLHLPLTAADFAAECSHQSPLKVPVDKRNPILPLIVRQFRRNQNDSSPRLIHAALVSGYKFVDLLVKAQDTTSPEHTQVVDYLVAHPPKPPKEPKPKPITKPLLIRVPSRDPGGVPTYISAERPLPLEALSGKRGIPRLCSTAHGIPFLRLGRKQSPALSNILRYKALQHEDRAQYRECAEEVLDGAIEEDWWEEIVAMVMERSGVPVDESLDDEDTYESTLKDGQDYVNAQMDWDRRDNINKARAMMKIMLEEERLAKKEALQRNPRLPEKLIGL